MSNLLLAPRISEKAIMLAQKGTYIFEVPTSTNKIEVTKAVESAFKVNVTAVNIIIAKGKLKRFKKLMGRQSDTKKALVTLKKGQSIDLFEAAK